MLTFNWKKKKKQVFVMRVWKWIGKSLNYFIWKLITWIHGINRNKTAIKSAKRIINICWSSDSKIRIIEFINKSYFFNNNLSHRKCFNFRFKFGNQLEKFRRTQTRKKWCWWFAWRNIRIKRIPKRIVVWHNFYRKERKNTRTRSGKFLVSSRFGVKRKCVLLIYYLWFCKCGELLSQERTEKREKNSRQVWSFFVSLNAAATETEQKSCVNEKKKS